MRKNQLTRRLAAAFLLVSMGGLSFAMNAGDTDKFNGVWVINEELSDNTDKRVEKAIKKMGGKIKRPKKKGKYRYKGGPAEQELYDHLAYSEILRFHYVEPEFILLYDNDFKRVFYSDGRGRTVSASGSAAREDYSFAAWDGNALYVEARPRDGGTTSEVYSLQSQGDQLRIELKLKPVSFGVPVEITRIYDRRK